MSKKIKLFIVASSLLNFILIGAIIGHIYHGSKMKHPKHLFHIKILKFLDSADLNKDQKDFFKSEISNIIPKKPHKRRVRSDKKELTKIIIADKFDASAFKNKLEERHQHFEKRRKVTTSLMIKFINSLTIKDRKKLGKVLNRD